jgi:hypothetical protein
MIAQGSSLNRGFRFAMAVMDQKDGRYFANYLHGFKAVASDEGCFLHPTLQSLNNTCKDVEDADWQMCCNKR